MYEAKFRGNLKVAAKQLKTDNEEASEKILEEFFNKIKTMKGLNHPNLIQLFAFTTGNSNFMIQEFMSEGDLKNYLQKLKKDPDRMRADTKLWSKLLSWNIEGARGMERLESLKIVHRDLAARYHTQVFFFANPDSSQERVVGSVFPGKGCKLWSCNGAK